MRTDSGVLASPSRIAVPDIGKAGNGYTKTSKADCCGDFHPTSTAGAILAVTDAVS